MEQGNAPSETNHVLPLESILHSQEEGVSVAQQAEDVAIQAAFVQPMTLPILMSRPVPIAAHASFADKFEALLHPNSEAAVALERQNADDHGPPASGSGVQQDEPKDIHQDSLQVPHQDSAVIDQPALEQSAMVPAALSISHPSITAEEQSSWANKIHAPLHGRPAPGPVHQDASYPHGSTTSGGAVLQENNEITQQDSGTVPLLDRMLAELEEGELTDEPDRIVVDEQGDMLDCHIGAPGFQPYNFFSRKADDILITLPSYSSDSVDDDDCEEGSPSLAEDVSDLIAEYTTPVASQVGATDIHPSRRQLMEKYASTKQASPKKSLKDSAKFQPIAGRGPQKSGANAERFVPWRMMTSGQTTKVNGVAPSSSSQLGQLAMSPASGSVARFVAPKSAPVALRRSRRERKQSYRQGESARLPHAQPLPLSAAAAHDGYSAFQYLCRQNDVKPIYDLVDLPSGLMRPSVEFCGEVVTGPDGAYASKNEGKKAVAKLAFTRLNTLVSSGRVSKPGYDHRSEAEGVDWAAVLEGFRNKSKAPAAEYVFGRGPDKVYIVTVRIWWCPDQIFKDPSGPIRKRKTAKSNAAKQAVTWLIDNGYMGANGEVLKMWSKDAMVMN